MGIWVGGVIQGLPHPHMAHGTPGNLGAFPALLVDINGRRFTNEDIPGQTFSNVAELLPRKVWWQIASLYKEAQLAAAAETAAAAEAQAASANYADGTYEASGTTGVDAVSGATVTSSAIFSAVEECLAQAGA